MCLTLVVENERNARRLSRRFPNAEVRLARPDAQNDLLDRYRRGELSLDTLKHLWGFQGQVNRWGSLREKLALAQAIDYYKFDPWTGEGKFV